MTSLRDLELELAATKYWLRVLYSRVLPAKDANAIRQTIVHLKNQAPPDDAPPKWEEMVQARLPAIERIGEDIAHYLEENGR